MHESCSDRTITISSRMLSNGLEEELDCSVGNGQVVDEASPLVDKSVVQRLKVLQALKDEGLITEEEYRKIRLRILGSL